jgi:hypothetical protein
MAGRGCTPVTDTWRFKIYIYPSNTQSIESSVAANRRPVVAQCNNQAIVKFKSGIRSAHVATVVRNYAFINVVWQSASLNSSQNESLRHNNGLMIQWTNLTALLRVGLYSTEKTLWYSCTWKDITDYIQDQIHTTHNLATWVKYNKKPFRKSSSSCFPMKTTR